MATQVQFRRGTTAEHASFTGAVGEVTVDTTLDTLRVHDGATAAGVRIAKFSEIPTTFNFTVEADDSAGVPISTDGTGTLRFAGQNSITTSSDSSGTLNIALNDDITVDQIAAKDSSSINITSPIQVTGNINTDTSLTIAGSTTVTSVLDEDNLVSDSATALATQQSIKAYVDGEVSSLSSTSITQGNSNVTVADSGTGTVTVTIDGATHTTFAAAGLSTDTVNVNVLNSTDSSAIQVTDALNVSGAVTSAGGFVGDVTGNASSADQVKTVDADGDDNAYFVTFVNSQDSTATANDLKVDGGLSYNPSTNVLTTTASSAQYADLAEKYRADKSYDEGHVVILGGSEEITESTQENDTRIAGVISEHWAYLMNEQENGPAVALKGKVECKVVGSVAKGDILVSSSTPGHAVASDTPNPMAVIGRSMVDDSNTHPRKIYIKI